MRLDQCFAMHWANGDGHDTAVPMIICQRRHPSSGCQAPAQAWCCAHQHSRRSGFFVQLVRSHAGKPFKWCLNHLVSSQQHRSFWHRHHVPSCADSGPSRRAAKEEDEQQRCSKLPGWRRRADLLHLVNSYLSSANGSVPFRHQGEDAQPAALDIAAATECNQLHSL